MRRLTAFLAAALLVLVLPGAAAAAVPPNDDFANATLVASVPFHDALDTTEATNEPVDEEAAEGCWDVPAVIGTVWYAFTPADEGDYFVDLSGSDYSSGAIVVSGAPGSFEFAGCGWQEMSWYAEAGVTYFVMAFSDTEGVTGGNLDVVIDKVPPPPEVLGLTIDPIGYVSRSTRMITITGTVTLSEEAVAEIGSTLRQRAGRVWLTADGWTALTVSPEGTWSITTQYVSGKFVGGKATYELWAYAYRPDDEISTRDTTEPNPITGTIRLRQVP